MNSTVWIVDSYEEALAKNIVIVSLGLIINFINGMLVVTFFSNPMFSRDSRYILYIHLVINDMLMICISVTLYVLTYISPLVNSPLCYTLVVLGTTTFTITPLNLAGMAIERFIAICKPLHHAQICTPQRTHIFICLIWVVGAMPSLADIIILLSVQPISLFRSTVLCYTFNLFPTKHNKDRITASQVICMSLVWITLIYTYCRVLFTAGKAISKGSANKARSTILLHGVQLLLCMLSYITPVMDMFVSPYFPVHRTNISFFNYLITNIMPRLLSPLIYGVRDQRFLKQLKELFACKIIIVKIVPSKLWYCFFIWLDLYRNINIIIWFIYLFIIFIYEICFIWENISENRNSLPKILQTWIIMNFQCKKMMNGISSKLTSLIHVQCLFISWCLDDF